jgi:probable phosphoglycerate mutase
LGSIIFLRHGQAKNNTERVLAGRTPGIPLTEKGIDQAEKAAKFLEDMNISAIYSSPIQRAKNTAEIVGKHNSIDVKIDDRLIELDMGKFTGIPMMKSFLVMEMYS